MFRKASSLARSPRRTCAGTLPSGTAVTEAGDAGGELFYLPQVRRIRRGDAPVHALVLDLDHLVEPAEGGRHRPDALAVDGPHLPHRYHDATRPLRIRCPPEATV